MILVVVILETVYPIFEFVAFEEVETVLSTVGGVAFDMKVASAENNFDIAENIPDPAAAADGPAAVDDDVGPAAASYYSS